jgi:WD40 repeat protein
VAFAPDGKLVASGSADGVVTLWAVAEGKLRAITLLRANPGSVSLVAFTRSGEDLIGSQVSPARRPGDLRSAVRRGQETRAELGNQLRRTDLRTDSHESSALLALSRSGTLRMWDLPSLTAAMPRVFGKMMLGDPHEELLKANLSAIIDDYRGDIRCLDFLPNDRTLVMGDYEGGLNFWRPGEPARSSLDRTRRSILSIALAPDGQSLATGDVDGAVTLWDLTVGGRRVGDPLKGHVGKVTALAFSPDGKTLASGGQDRTIRLWYLSERPIRSRILDPQTVEIDTMWENQGVISVVFSPDGKQLASCGWKDVINLWDVTRRESQEPIEQKPIELEGHKGLVNSVAYSRDGKVLASGGLDSTVRLWSPTPARKGLLAELRGHSDRVNTVAFSPDGKTLASGGNDKTVRLWDVDSRRERATLQHIENVGSVAFSRDGKALVARAIYGPAMLWYAATEAEASRRSD